MPVLPGAWLVRLAQARSTTATPPLLRVATHLCRRANAPGAAMAGPQQRLMATLLSSVAAGTDSAAVQALLQCERDPSFRGACAAGALDASQLQGPDGKPHTPLFIAASRGLERCVARLLELGASAGAAQVRAQIRAAFRVPCVLCAQRPTQRFSQHVLTEGSTRARAAHQSCDPRECVAHEARAGGQLRALSSLQLQHEPRRLVKSCSKLAGRSRAHGATRRGHQPAC